MQEKASKAAETVSEAGLTEHPEKGTGKKKQARKTPQIRPDIKAKAEAMKAGKYGHGLKMIAALGDDAAEVLKAALQ